MNSRSIRRAMKVWLCALAATLVRADADPSAAKRPSRQQLREECELALRGHNAPPADLVFQTLDLARYVAMIHDAFEDSLAAIEGNVDAVVALSRPTGFCVPPPTKTFGLTKPLAEAFWQMIECGLEDRNVLRRAIYTIGTHERLTHEVSVEHTKLGQAIINNLQRLRDVAATGATMSSYPNSTDVSLDFHTNIRKTLKYPLPDPRRLAFDLRFLGMANVLGDERARIILLTFLRHELPTIVRLHRAIGLRLRLVQRSTPVPPPSPAEVGLAQDLFARVEVLRQALEDMIVAPHSTTPAPAPRDRPAPSTLPDFEDGEASTDVAVVYEDLHRAVGAIPDLLAAAEDGPGPVDIDYDVDVASLPSIVDQSRRITRAREAAFERRRRIDEVAARLAGLVPWVERRLAALDWIASDDRRVASLTPPQKTLLADASRLGPKAHEVVVLAAAAARRRHDAEGAVIAHLFTAQIALGNSAATLASGDGDAAAASESSRAGTNALPRPSIESEAR